MGYYVRVLSTSAEPVPFADLKAALGELKATLATDEGEENEWEQWLLAHADGLEIAAIERDLVEDGSLEAEELDEFREDLEDALPRSAADWLGEFFNRVKCIYACQILSGIEHLNGWEIFGTLKNALWSFAPSILQADREGFSNEAGFHILWQFSDGVDYSWRMGVLVDGEWRHFEMELSNRSQREAFLRGEIPVGVKMA